MIEELYKLYLRSRTVTTDSRRITPGCLFFAFKGETFDGNTFAPQALEQGAAACIVSDARYRVDDRCFVTDDVLATLQALARMHRSHLTIPVIGITGTNGKTTTKELVHAVLSRRYRTSATAGNLNNHLGVPLTLLGIPADAEIAIVEMGANHPGEIAALCDIAQPDYGLVTNIGRAHLEGFGGFEGVVRTKTELYRHLDSLGGTLFVNADDQLLTAEAAKLTHLRQTIGYGDSNDADCKGHLRDAAPYLALYIESGDNVYSIQTQLIGGYNLPNALAAAAVGQHFKVDMFDIKEALEQYQPSNNRSQYKKTGRNELLLDCYNANPSSMKVAVESFKNMKADHKIAIIGGMHELGAAEREEHRKLVEALDGCGLERCLLVGHEFEGLALPHSMTLFSDTDAVRDYLRAHTIEGATVLVKGSNTNRLWTLEELL